MNDEVKYPAQARYRKAKTKDFSVRYPLNNPDLILLLQYCKYKNIAVATFIKQAIKETIERDKSFLAGKIDDMTDVPGK